MNVILIIAHHSILPGAYMGFEKVLDRLHHELPKTRVASTSLLNFENDLRILLREDVDSVTILPYLLLNGQHTKNDVPKVVENMQKEFSHIPITLLPCLGDWDVFADMVVKGISLSNERILTYSQTKTLTENNDFKLLALEMNLDGRNVLVVGGGRIALRKVKNLVLTGARITIVAPQFDSEFEHYSNSILEKGFNPITFLKRPYERGDLRGVFLVFICSDNPCVNAQVSNDARSRRILVNNACDYLNGDFIVPARMDFGKNITVTVSTQGKSPSFAKKLKEKIQKEWSNELIELEKNCNF